MKTLIKIFIIVTLFSMQITAQDFWEKVNVPDSLIGIYALDFNSNNDIFAFAVDSIGDATSGDDTRNLLRSTDDGINWSGILDFWDNNFRFYAEVIVNNNNIFLAYSSSEGCGAGGPFPWEPFFLYRSPDNGYAWNLESISKAGVDGVDIEISPSGTVYCISDSFYCWNDIEEDWTMLSECPGYCLTINSRDELFVIQEISGDSLEILRSTDNAMSWDSIIAYIGDENESHYFVRLICSPHDELFLSANNKVYKSSNNGEVWDLLSEGLSDSTIRCLAINTTGDVFAGTWGDGVYRLPHNVDSWTKVNTGLTNPYINCLSINSNGIIYAGVGHGIYCRPPTSYRECGLFRSVKPTSIEKINEAAAVYKLSQNYPNPFNPSTKIKFALPKPETVRIEVYNIIGQKIETLLNKPMPAGYHEVAFNGQNLSSGVYLYKIEAGEFQDVKKMVLLK